MTIVRALVSIFLATCVLAIGRLTYAQATSTRTGVVEGRVVDAATNEPLPGAKVVVMGSVLETSTDRDGVFRLSGVAPGLQTIVITYLGRRDETAAVDVTAGVARKLDARLSVSAFEETVTVQAGLIEDANARALNQ